jgi:hypothetical protein
MDSQTASSQVANAVAELKGIPTREALLELLQTSLVQVTFNKISGDERVMTCTLKPDHLPAATKEDPLSQTKIRNLEAENIVVWDVNANAWRSFRYNRVTKVWQMP